MERFAAKIQDFRLVRAGFSLAQFLVFIIIFIGLWAVVSAALSAPLKGFELRGHGGPVKSVEITANGKMAITASFDYSIILWDLSIARTPRIIARLEGHEAAVNAAMFVPGGKLVLSASDDGMVGLWDIAKHKLLHKFKGHSSKVVKLATSPDGNIAASAGWDRTIRLWDLKSRRQIAVLNGHSNNVNAVIFSNDGKYIYSGGYDGTIRLWRASDGKFIRTVLKHGWGVNVLAALPGKVEKLAFGALDGSVSLLNVEAGKVEKKLASHEGPVLSLFVSKRHKILATGGGDGKIYVWALGSWEPVRQHHNPSSPIWSMAVAGDGKSIYFAGLDDFVIHWEVTPGKPFDPVKSKFPRRFQVSKKLGLGERQFARKCSICHSLTPKSAHRAGPTLYKLFGRKVGTVSDYVYSKALKSSNIIWNGETIGRLFSEGPEHFTPGSKMPLQRIKSKQIRDALVAYLKRVTEGKPRSLR